MYWLIITLIILAGFEYFTAFIEWFWPRSIGGNTIWRGTAKGRFISITFDDGPSKYTDEILTILKDNNISATFFVRGYQAKKYPETIKRMALEGHEIGNHLYSFDAKRKIFKLYYPIDESEISNTQSKIESLTGKTPRYFRSPGGQMGRKLWRAVRAHQLTVVNGTVPFPDPEKDSVSQLKTIESTLRPGAIIILHDGDDHYPESDRPKAVVALLPDFIKLLVRGKYSVVGLNGGSKRPQW